MPKKNRNVDSLQQTLPPFLYLPSHYTDTCRSCQYSRCSFSLRPRNGVRLRNFKEPNTKIFHHNHTARTCTYFVVFNHSVANKCIFFFLLNHKVFLLLRIGSTCTCSILNLQTYAILVSILGEILNNNFPKCQVSPNVRLKVCPVCPALK